jgi:hypothetical protein
VQPGGICRIGKRGCDKPIRGPRIPFVRIGHLKAGFASVVIDNKPWPPTVLLNVADSGFLHVVLASVRVSPNLSRVKDTAMALAVQFLNGDMTARPAEEPPMRQNPEAVSEAAE